MKENNRMKQAIELRMGSDAWDMRIAQSVLTRRSSARERFLFSGSIASMATAGLAVIVLSVSLYLWEAGTTKEIQGSYSYALTTDEYNFESDTVSSEIGSLINEAYPMR